MHNSLPLQTVALIIIKKKYSRVIDNVQYLRFIMKANYDTDIKTFLNWLCIYSDIFIDTVMTSAISYSVKIKLEIKFPTLAGQSLYKFAYPI